MLAFMRLALCLLVAGAAFGLLACGGGNDSTSTTGQTTPTHPARTPAPAGGKSSARIPSVFVEAARVCAVGPPAKVAQNLGIKSTDPRSIATALAQGYKPRFRRSAYRGCLTALK
jgi:hypothetical protein